METYNTEAIISSSLENVTKLKDQLSKIEQLRDDVNQIIALAREVPEHFNRLGGNLAITTSDYITKNDEILKGQIQNFDNKINDLQQRIDQIDQINFTDKFQQSKDAYFDELTKITEEKINGFNGSAEALRTVKNDFEGEVSRLTAVDLEAHFNKHSKRLSDIFGATNNINSSLLTISNQTMVFQERLSSLEQKNAEIKSTITELQSALQNEIKALKFSQDALLQKQNSNFTILMVLIAVAILATVILHFI